jgi:DNA-binding NtrC family response regulator
MDQMRRKARLLAIDDHADSAELIARIATKIGYDARAVSGPDQLRENLSNWQPDILTLDLCMPEEDGLGVFSLLEHMRYTGSIVIISGHDEWLRTSASRLASALGLQIAGNLAKPIDLKQLRTLLADFQANIAAE